MHNLAFVINRAQRTRQSTRLPKTIPITIMGADAFQAPYVEQVSTQDISCHGCRYFSKYDVIQGSPVTLEIGGGEKQESSRAVRAHVVRVHRPEKAEESFEVAVEFEQPGNFWGIPAPADDWLGVPDAAAENVSTPSAEPTPRPAARTMPAGPPSAPERKAARLPAADGQVVVMRSSQMTQLLHQLGDQIQGLASEAVAMTVAEQAGRVHEVLHAQLREEVKEAAISVAASQSDDWVRRTLDQIKAELDTAAKGLHEKWAEKMQSELRQADDHLEGRLAQLGQRAEGIAAHALDGMERVLEQSERDWTARFVTQLEQQMAPLLQHAQTSSTKLAACRQELEELLTAHRAEVSDVLENSTRKCAERMHELSTRTEQQFDQIIHDKMAKSVGQFDSSQAAIASAALTSLQKASQAHVKQAESGLRASLEPALEKAENDFEEKARQISKIFATQLNDYSRHLFEHIAELVAELPGKIADVRPPQLEEESIQVESIRN